jgi:hypothetical protein
MRKVFTCCLLALIIAGETLYAQSGNTLQELKIQERQVSLQNELPELRKYLKDVLGRSKWVMAYIRFSAGPDKQKLSASGIHIQDYIGQNVYSVLFRSDIETAILQSAGVSAWAAPVPADKINPWLLDESNITGENIDVLVSVTRQMSPADLASALQEYGIPVPVEQPWKSQDIWKLEIPKIILNRLAASGFVRFVNPEFKPQALHQQAMGFTNTQAAHQPLSVGGYNLHGEGVTIGVGDDTDPAHVDYTDRVNSFNPVYSGTHGLHTTGTVSGNGIRDERYRGFASKCNLISDFFSQVMANGSIYHQDFNMVISSNSYGNVLGNCSYAGTYDVYSQFTDQQMRDHPNLLNVFAAANDGYLTCSPYPLGYATVTAAFATAKNGLTVANIGKSRHIPNSATSRGPVKDGRLKPEITAVGDHLYSTIDNDNYAWNSGTSMSCPNVAGASGLLYQRYRQLFAGADPQSALVKLLMMNGATDLDIPGPDFTYGFGLMNTGRSLRMMDSTWYFTNTINTTQEHTYTFTVPANTAQAKVMLYWNDAPAAPLSATTLVNDLDLTVTTPASATLLPLILNPAPGQVTAAAVQGADHVNNVEQVTLNNPAPGTYTIKVKGFNVPEINQEYFVAYDFIADGITLQYPFGGEALNTTDSMVIYWEASAGTNPFTISYSTNNGGTWNTINNNIGPDERTYIWFPPAIASDQCLVRINRNSTAQQSQSKLFTMIGRPVASLNPIAEQCPGSIRFNWNTIAGAGSYRVFRKLGDDMVAVATIPGTDYTFNGLTPDSTYWVAVAPVINGKIGMRSVALSRKPADGGCSGAAHGDLMLAQIVNPQSGRKFTSTELSASQLLKVIISNFDDQAANNYRISYRVNGNPWISQSYTDVISPVGSRLITIANNLNLSAVGTYTITVAVTNLAVADPVTGNDTLVLTVKQLDNPVINLSGGYEERFETVNNLNLTGAALMGINGADRWDFTQSKPKGRIRSFVNSDITIEGNRSMSLDNAFNQRFDIPGSSYNTLTGTFNLSTYNTTNWEVRCEFDYLMHGFPKFDTGNKAWVRGNDTDPWLPLLSYQIDTNNLGVIYNSGTLSLTDILTAGGQTFSSSTQVRFTQYDTSRIAATYFGNGVTMDNFKLYTVTDDVHLMSVDSIYHYNCGLSNAVPLKVTLRNGVNNTVYNIAVSYQLDNQPVVTEMIDSIIGKDTLSYTFIQTADLSANMDYNLSTWVYVATDTYRLNDSIMNFRIRNQPVVAAYPYLEDFESDEGFFYAEGSNSSWEYGTPASSKIDHAASGTKAWKTTLAGTYNKQEMSYLYSPCFDISGLAMPTLSFSLATDVEPPGNAVFDIAYVEYSNDGYTWQRLGQAGQGTNWYNNDSIQAWTKEGETYWHVATIPLPQSGNIVSFRFVMKSDQGSEYEGVALDDIHIYDLQHPIFNQEQFPAAVSQNVAAGQTANFVSGNNIGVTLVNSTSSLGNTSVQAYKHAQFINADSTQYYLPKNFTIQTANAPGDSLIVRLYVPDEAMRTVREDAACYSCSKPVEVYQMGITKYDDPDKSRENNTLEDNLNGTYTYIPEAKVRWVPYDIGYYAETKVKSFSEFWFNDGGPTHDQPLPVNLFDFTASHYGVRYAQLNWASFIDVQTQKYDLQRADASLNFHTFATVNAVGANGNNYNYIDTPALQGPSVFYRVKYTLLNGNEHVSLIRRLDWDGSGGTINVYPNPVRNGILTIEWFKGNGEPLEWGLYNIIGQQINHGKIENNPYSGKQTLDMNELAISSGMYLLKIHSGKDKWEFKLVYQ